MGGSRLGHALLGSRAAWRLFPHAARDRDQALLVPGMFGTIAVYDLVWEDGRPVRVMDVDGTFQSATYTDSGWCDPVFEYYVLYDLMFCGPTPVHHALMLGGAGYGYPKYLISNHPDVALDVVEKDPAATKLAWSYFYLGRLVRAYHTRRNHRLGLVRSDALDYLRKCSKDGKRYDAVLNDCFCAGTPDGSLATVEAARLAHDVLADGGTYLSNVVSALEGPRSVELQHTSKALAAAFRHVYVVSTNRNAPNQPDNLMVVACDAELELPFARTLA